MGIFFPPQQPHVGKGLESDDSKVGQGFNQWSIFIRASPGVLVVNNLPANAGDLRDMNLSPR